MNSYKSRNHPWLLISVFLLCYYNTNAQGGTWVWMNGPDTLNGKGNYGTRGVAAASNCPPAFYQAAQWKDKQGNLWIYGGQGANPYRLPGDLWKFDPIVNMWTWVNGSGIGTASATFAALGIPSPANNPGGRQLGYPSWTDTSGDLWLFAGNGLCDLWRYNIASNEWTCMAYTYSPGIFGNLYQLSDSAIPGYRREENAAWTDANNNLWLFGGQRSTGIANDLWRYNVALGQWAWMGGSQSLNDAGSYGTLGVESPANRPPAREGRTRWTDSCYLYLASGAGQGLFNDVWRFNLNNNYWTWIGGDSGNAPNGQYTAYCYTANGDMPAGRTEERTAQLNGCTPLLFMWGGNNHSGHLNDLWSFDLGSNKWKWISGTDTGTFYGNFGTKGVPLATNMPPGMMGGCFWGDNSGHLWLWGGEGQGGSYNAMWEFIPDPTCLSIDTSNLSYQLSRTSICNGDSALISFNTGYSLSVAPNSNVTWLDSLHALLKPDSTTVFTINGYTPCGNYRVQNFTLPVMGSSNLSYQLSRTSICNGDSALISFNTGYSLSVAPNSNVTWLDSLHALLKPDSTTVFTINGYTPCGNYRVQNFTLPVMGSSNLSYQLSRTSICNGDSALISFNGGYSLSIAPNNNVSWLDSLHALLKPDSTTVFTISGYTACGDYNSQNFTLPVTGSSNLSYQLSRTSICNGDSALISFNGGYSLSVAPNNNVTWLDSLHALLKPDSTTVFTINGYTPCGNYRVQNFTLPVMGSSNLSYQLSRTSICNGDSALINFNGGYSLSIAPNSNVTWLDSLHAVLKPGSTTVFTISGYTVCGDYNSQNFTLPVTGSSNLSYQLSRTSICNGDSALISFNGGYSLSVAPNNNVTWLDSLHAVLKPDSITVFTISGYTACGDYNIQSFTLPVIHLLADITSNKTSMCAGDTAQICATPGYTSYYWNTRDTGTCIYAQSAGYYYVTVTDSSGCPASSIRLSINVYPSSHISISINGDTLSGYDANSYQWLLAGVPISGANTSVYVATTPGSYVLEVTDSNGCITRSNPVIISGIAEDFFSDNISVFPNPTNTGWQLSVDPILLGSLAEVFDATGRLIFKSAITNLQSTIYLAGAAPGVYELRLTSHQFSVVRKLVKL